MAVEITGPASKVIVSAIGTGVIVQSPATAIVVSKGASTGEINTVANVGGGDAEVFRDKIGSILNLRTISGINGVTVAENGNVIEIGTPGTSGDVVGPGSSIDNELALFDGVTGKLIKGGSGWTVNAGGNLVPSDSPDANLVDGRDVSTDGAIIDALGATYAPLVHATRHENGGADEIDVGGLSGLLADAQTPADHASTHAGAGSDPITTLGAITFTGAIDFTGATVVNGLTDGDLLLTDTAGTGFNMLQFGGTGGTRPAIKRVGANLEIKLASDVSYADLTCKNIVATNSILVNVDLRVGGSSKMYWNTRSRMRSPVDGNITLLDALETGFGLLQLGGTSASYPALKRSGTSLHVRLANDSTYGGLNASIITASSHVVVGAAAGLIWSGRTFMQSPVNGNMMMSNNAANDFGLLQLGGVTSSFPALKRSTTAPSPGLESRLADDSGRGYLCSYHIGINREPTTTHMLIGSEAFTGTGNIVGYGCFPESAPSSSAANIITSIQGNTWFSTVNWGAGSRVQCLDFYPAPLIAGTAFGSANLDISAINTAGLLNIVGRTVTANTITAIALTPLTNIFAGTDDTTANVVRALYVYSAAATTGTWGRLTGIEVEPQTSGAINQGIWMAGDNVGCDIVFGGGQDANIFYDSSNLIIDPDLAGSGIVLIGTTGDDDMLLNSIEIDGDLNHDGSGVGFYGTAPVAQSAAYTPTNVSADRAYDADATTVNELADVLGTLIADLQATGLIG